MAKPSAPEAPEQASPETVGGAVARPHSRAFAGPLTPPPPPPTTGPWPRPTPALAPPLTLRRP